MKIAVIGAGASGIIAALQAACAGAEVTLFERNQTVGRKLLVTGSGRCNISNQNVSAEKYDCADRAWLEQVFTSFGVNETLAMFKKLGILVYHTDDGWYYPLSNSAQSVVAILAGALAAANVEQLLSCRVETIFRRDRHLVVKYHHSGSNEERQFDRVIIATGGKAYPTLGSTGDLFPVLEHLGHTVTPKRPALAPVQVELGSFKALLGVRLDAGVTLLDKRKKLAIAAGNLIFTDFGLNGPPVMNISHHISAPPGQRLELSLNLLEFHHHDFHELLNQKRHSAFPVSSLLSAFLPPKAVQLYLLLATINETQNLANLDDQEVGRLVSLLQDVRFEVKGVRGFMYCQLSAGGVPVSEVEPETMASKRINGLYLAGETLDMVGPCGGYNLQFAFSSGAIAGRSAALS